LTEDKDTADKAEKMLEKAPKESKKIPKTSVLKREKDDADAPAKKPRAKKVD
jgi:hypothetical protein